MAYEYSPQEDKIFSLLGLEKAWYADCHPMSVLSIAALKCFAKNLRGPHVEALRRGYDFVVYKGGYRDTREYKELLEF